MMLTQATSLVARNLGHPVSDHIIAGTATVARRRRNPDHPVCDEPDEKSEGRRSIAIE